MTILIKQALIVDPASPFNGEITDIFIENGIIKKIDKKLSVKADKEISIQGLHVSTGWMDVFANFADPGYEFKETLETGAEAAAADRALALSVSCTRDARGSRSADARARCVERRGGT